MTKFKQFKALISEFKGVVDFFTDDCERINFIYVEANLVEFTKPEMGRCGCCYEIESHSMPVDEFLDYISEDDFEMLVKEIIE
jgi:hypothetical protein